MYTSFINEPSEIRVYDLWCHIDVQPEAVLLLQWMGNWLGGFFNRYLSSETWISTHATVQRDCTLFPQLSCTTIVWYYWSVNLWTLPLLCFEGTICDSNVSKRIGPLPNVKTSEPDIAVRLIDRSFNTNARQQLHLNNECLMVGSDNTEGLFASVIL